MRQRCRVHLEVETVDASKGIAVSYYLLSDFLRVSDQQRSIWSPLCVEGLARHRSPAAFLPDIGDGFGEARKEILDCVLRRLGNVARRMNSDFQLTGWVAGSPSCLPVEIDEWTEPARLSSYDGDHQWKP